MSTKTTFVAGAVVACLVVTLGCNEDDGTLSVATGGAGATPPATGGTTTGGAGSATAGSAGTPAAGIPWVQAGGYVVAGPWHGYAWTAASATGSTITPVNYSELSSQTQLCASGSVAAMADYSGTGMIGVNLSQESDGTDPPVETWTPTSIASGGITVNVNNPGGSTVRVQIQAPGGDSDGTKRWCAPVTAFGQTITVPWSAFNTMCWNAQGASYAGEALESVIIIVPGGQPRRRGFRLLSRCTVPRRVGGHVRVITTNGCDSITSRPRACSPPGVPRPRLPASARNRVSSSRLASAARMGAPRASAVYGWRATALPARWPTRPVRSVHGRSR